jgi:hypothetical protein
MDLLPVAAFLMKNFPPFYLPSSLSFLPLFTKSASLPFIASLFSSLRASLLTVVLYLLLPFLYHYVLYVYMCMFTWFCVCDKYKQSDPNIGDIRLSLPLTLFK